MNFLRNLKVALIKFNKKLEPVLDKYGHKYKVYFYLDMLWCGIRYKMPPSEYLEFETYKYKGLVRKNLVTWGFLEEYTKKHVSKEDIKILDNKVDFNNKFNKYLGREYIYVPNASKLEIHDFLANKSKIMIKSIALQGGRGVYSKTLDSNFDFENFYNDIKDKDVLIEEYIKQHKEIAKFNESSVNTLRIYTFNKNNNVEIKSVALRIGAEGSDVDNASSGGSFVPINLETGKIMGPGTDYVGNLKYFYGKDNIFCIGQQIPNFEEVKKRVIEMANEVPNIMYVAWDMVVLENGEIACIEANNYGGSFILQNCINNKLQLTPIKNMFKEGQC